MSFSLQRPSPLRAAMALPRGGYGAGALSCLAATIAFGLMFPVMTGALTRIDPFTFTSARYLIASIVSLVLLRAVEGPGALRLRGEPIAKGWLLGSIGFAGFGFLVFLGQQMVGCEGALTVSIMAATQPMLAVLINSITRRVLPPRYTLLCVALSFCGVALVITKGDIGSLLQQPQRYSADALVLLGLLAWIIYTFGVASFTTWSSLKYTTMTMCLGLTSIVAINLALFAAHLIPVPSAEELAAIVPHLLYMSLIGSVVGVLFWNIGNKIITPVNGVLFTNVVPITAFVVSAIGGVTPASVQIVGACMTGAALILNNIYSRRRAQPAA